MRSGLTQNRSLLFVEAEARMESFTDKEGNPRSNLSLIASTYMSSLWSCGMEANVYVSRELRRPVSLEPCRGSRERRGIGARGICLDGSLLTVERRTGVDNWVIMSGRRSSTRLVDFFMRRWGNFLFDVSKNWIRRCKIILARVACVQSPL